MILFRGGQPIKQVANPPLGAPFERIEGLATARGHRQQALPAVVWRDFFADQPTLVEPAQDAAAVTGVETEVASDVARRHAVALLDLIEHPGLGQRKCTVEPARPQHAEILSIKTIKAAHRGNALRLLDAGDCHADSIGQLLARVKYLVRIRRYARDGTV